MHIIFWALIQLPLASLLDFSVFFKYFCDWIEVCQLVGVFNLESLIVCHAHIHAELERDSLINLINEKGDATFAVAKDFIADHQSTVKDCDFLLFKLAFLVRNARLFTVQDSLYALFKMLIEALPLINYLHAQVIAVQVVRSQVSNSATKIKLVGRLSQVH